MQIIYAWIEIHEELTFHAKIVVERLSSISPGYTGLDLITRLASHSMSVTLNSV